jgi:hypothetical protein
MGYAFFQVFIDNQDVKGYIHPSCFLGENSLFESTLISAENY